MRRGVFGRNFGFISSVMLRDDRLRGELSRSQRVINSFAGKRLHHSRCVADEEKRSVGSGDRCACQRSDRSPRMFGRNPETRFRPTAQGRHLAWNTDQANVQFAVPDRGLAGISFRQELENDAISEVVWQWQVSLQRNALLRASWKQVAEPGDGRVPAIGSDKHLGLEGFSRRGNRPILSPRSRASQRCHRAPFANSGAKFTRSPHRELIEKATLDGDFSVVASGQGHRQGSTTKANELDAIEHAVRQNPNAFR